MRVCLTQARRSAFYILLFCLKVQSFAPRILNLHPHLGDAYFSTCIEASSSDTTSSAVNNPTTASSSTLLRNGRPSRPSRRVTLRRYLAGIVKEKSDVSIVLLTASFVFPKAAQDGSNHLTTNLSLVCIFLKVT